MQYSGVSEEIDLNSADNGEEIKEIVKKARRNREEKFRFESKRYIYQAEWSERQEKVQVDMFAVIGKFTPSKTSAKTLEEFEE